MCVVEPTDCEEQRNAADRELLFYSRAGTVIQRRIIHEHMLGKVMPMKEGGDKVREKGKEDVYVNVNLRKEGQPERKKQTGHEATTQTGHKKSYFNTH